MKDILEAFGVDVLHTYQAATVEINDPEIVAEIQNRADVTIWNERDNIYVVKSN